MINNAWEKCGVSRSVFEHINPSFGCFLIMGFYRAENRSENDRVVFLYFVQRINAHDEASVCVSGIRCCLVHVFSALSHGMLK